MTPTLQVNYKNKKLQKVFHVTVHQHSTEKTTEYKDKRLAVLALQPLVWVPLLSQPWFLLHDGQTAQSSYLVRVAALTVGNAPREVAVAGRGWSFAAARPPAAPGPSCRPELRVLFLLRLKHHLQSSKVGVRNLLSLSISSWLSSICKNKMGRAEGVWWGACAPETQLQWHQAHSTGGECHTQSKWFRDCVCGVKLNYIS